MGTVREDALELTLALNPVIGTTRMIADTCERICRLARKHHRRQERLRNGFRDEAAQVAEERADERNEAAIRDAVAELPEWEENGERGRFGVLFDGDPRGCTVKLTGPRSIYDSWGGDGVCVPQRP